MIKSAEFLVSNSRQDRCPQTTLPEFAFIGRSNVGKSSLINMLTGRPQLAKASSTPGKTLLINHFLINGANQLPTHKDDRPSVSEILNQAGQDAYLIVDLPGYGYARISQKEREKLRIMIQSYCALRQQLVCLFVLIDVRHDPQQVDLDFMAWLAEHEVPFAIVFTKGDKLSKTALKHHVNSYQQKMLEYWEELPEMFITSAETTMGKNELITYIESLL